MLPVQQHCPPDVKSVGELRTRLGRAWGIEELISEIQIFPCVMDQVLPASYDLGKLQQHALAGRLHIKAATSAGS